MAKVYPAKTVITLMHGLTQRAIPCLLLKQTNRPAGHVRLALDVLLLQTSNNEFPTWTLVLSSICDERTIRSLLLSNRTIVRVAAIYVVFRPSFRGVVRLSHGKSAGDGPRKAEAARVSIGSLDKARGPWTLSSPCSSAKVG